MNCKDFREIIDSYLSDELLTETNHGVLSHLEACSGCRGEIEARRIIRGRLRSALRKQPENVIDGEFAKDLGVSLRAELARSRRTKRLFLSNAKSWAAVAAGLLIVFTFGFVFLNQSEMSSSLKADGKSYRIPELPPAHLVNVALGDHEHCAIKHGSVKEHPVSLVKAAAEYRGVTKAVVPPLKKVLTNYELIESHFCKYKDVKFAHLILKDKENVVSVLVADLKGYERLEDGQIQKRSAEKYQIARFDTRKQAVFVVSNLNEQKNFQATEALHKPLQDYFSEGKQLQSAFLTFF